MVATVQPGRKERCPEGIPGSIAVDHGPTRDADGRHLHPYAVPTVHERARGPRGRHHHAGASSLEDSAHHLSEAVTDCDRRQEDEVGGIDLSEHRESAYDLEVALAYTGATDEAGELEKH